MSKRGQNPPPPDGAPEGPVTLNQPRPPMAMNPRVVEYQRDLAARRGGTPVGGDPTPPIPLLTTEIDPQRPQPMSNYAVNMQQVQQAQAKQAEAMGMPRPLGGIFGGEMPQQIATPVQQASSDAVRPQIFPGDLLPPDAMNDPTFQQGMGSSLAQYQPHLAAKYGVIRQGRHIPPQMVTPKAPGLSQKSIEDLKVLNDFNQKKEQAESGQDTAAAEAARSPSGAGAQLGGGTSPTTDKERQEILDKLDQFDFHTLREMMLKDVLNNEDQRKIIEERLKETGNELDLAQLVSVGRVRQIVPVVPGKYEPEFQSMTGEEDLALKRMIIAEAGTLEFENKYYLDKYSMMGITTTLYAVNRTVLPSHLDANGRFSEEAFNKKLEVVLRLPFHMLSSLGVHAFWFDIRVRSLFKVERIKNG